LGKNIYLNVNVMFTTFHMHLLQAKLRETRKVSYLPSYFKRKYTQ